MVQKIGEKGGKTEPVIKDMLVNGEYPHYISPYPLGSNANESGKYFLATGKMSGDDEWGLYLLDIFDNRTLIKKGNFANARPLAKRVKPPVIKAVPRSQMRVVRKALSTLPPFSSPILGSEAAPFFCRARPKFIKLVAATAIRMATQTGISASSGPSSRLGRLRFGQSLILGRTSVGSLSIPSPW